MLGFRRSLALSLTAIQSIPERIGASLVTVIGVLTVMAVLVTMLALGQGLERLAQTGARPDRVSVISAGSQSSLSSSVSRSALDKVMGKPGVRHDAQGRPLVTGVVLMIIDGVTKRNQHGSIGFFSAGPQWQEIWPNVQVIEGRDFEPGLHELLVSQSIRDRFKGMDVGDTVKARGVAWKIVGVYKDTGGFFDNSMVGDAATVLAAFPQSTYAGLTAILESPADFRRFKDSVTSDPSLSLDVQTEDDQRIRYQGAEGRPRLHQLFHRQSDGDRGSVWGLEQFVCLRGFADAGDCDHTGAWIRIRAGRHVGVG
jgi:putative ABC transport system permease protein